MKKLLVAAALFLAGCAGPARPLPGWTAPNTGTDPARLNEAHARQARDLDLALASLRNRAKRDGGLNILTLSAGGQAGAFGSGFVRGWGDVGTRPEFDLITGCSTGAMIAVFAFLGTDGDATLKDLYTTHDTSDVFRLRYWIEIPSSNSYADSSPLRGFLQHYITDATILRIADEAAKDRVLLISTSNLDLNEPRTWNISALAADSSLPLSRRTQRLRDILLAALSIPSLVPPVFIDGDMHADGGLVRQVFLWDAATLPDFISLVRADDSPAHIYSILNRRPAAGAQMTRNHIVPIISRSLQMMLDASLAKDVETLRRAAADSGATFGLISVPEDPARPEPDDFFDRSYMTYLHNLGHSKAHTPAWEH